MNEAIAPFGTAEYLAAHEAKGLLRFLTCGSVDDGKSTLIGRLLYDTKLLFEDQLATLASDSRKHGTAGGDLDFALLVDGLAAEREQGITIDVAYRFFATERRKFIVADTPGHEQYTRNMATGASNSDVAVILVDARKGILTQTRRHSFIVSLLGLKDVVLAVNKIDLMDYSQSVFDRIVADYRAFAAEFGFRTLVPIPISARHGDNVIARSANTPWYDGPSLLDHLDTLDVESGADTRPFRLPVQWVNRPDLNFRGFSGTVASGTVRVGEPVVVAGSGATSRVAAIVTADGELAEAGAGEAITLTLEDEIDASRGDVIAAAGARPEVSDQFAAHLIWMHEEPLLPGRPYLMKIGTRTVGMSVTEIKHRIDVNSFQKLAAKTLSLNDVAVVNVATHDPVALDPFAAIPQTGAFIVIDRMSNQTVGAGMVDFGLRRATNVHWQALDVSKASRAELKLQKPVMLWFTGLSGAGKSTIANLVEKRLTALGKHTYLLDGDNVRHGLNKDLGFTDVDRVENIRRVAEVSRLMVDAGLIVLVSFISPFRAERQMARELVEEGEFVEIFVDTPLEVAEERDVKGLYQRARAGLIRNFTGIDSPYEPPLHAEITIAGGALAAEAAAERILDYLLKKGYLG
ncbi:sulfate adenylyltransferase subunit CysN [Ancylobacter dichloromethanicus]|uniref:Multifunctional fusion protein n=1 Tax=Ancylobacter dichloromethanicus TaxID=518825 RepID=A0A9W6JBQ1_9HYPH|nr:sulfate adenylyltransferase subunit CysN [Ancylobacter dichloromethanicus]MBS7554957.1 sulfate adenylyltransferase subunit CysN [Ancylobacter dichloromethanicus]GLK73353.1 adenylyl-sulfate kinase [Ancylobacter dichloromethanicus]